MADLSGTWLGTYWQDGNPTRFEATLVQSGNALSGNILDDNDLGEASVNGEVVGRSVSFSKRYLTRSLNLVHYRGTVSADEDFMQGEWNIGSFTGLWEARRSTEDLIADLQKRLSEQLAGVAGR